MGMRVTFLGTSSAKPSPLRNVSGLFLSPFERKERWLFDCGDGTQLRILSAGLPLEHIRAIFISHMHGDHIFGLPGLLASMSLSNMPTEVELYGPAPLADFLESVRSYSAARRPSPFRFRALAEGAVAAIDGVAVECRLLDHRDPTYGFRITEPDAPGKLDVSALERDGVPEGSVRGRLKRGEDVTLEDGRVLRGRDYLGPARQGRVLAIVPDTSPCEASRALAKDADLLVHEATLDDAQSGTALERKHSTPSMAAETARGAGARRLALTHISPRYHDKPEDLAAMLAAAQAVFPETSLAEDLQSIDVPARTD